MNAPPIFALQVKDSGAWRNVIKGEASLMQDIQPDIEAIAAKAGPRVSWRIIDAAFGYVIAHCQAPDYIWKLPRKPE